MNRHRFALLLVFLTLFLSKTLEAQAPEYLFEVTALVDSLEAELDTSRSERERYELHFHLTETLLSMDAERCLTHAREAIRLARKFEDTYYTAYLMNYEANCYDDLGMYEAAIDKYEEAIEYTYHHMRSMTGDTLKDFQWDLVAFYNNLGYSYFNLGRYMKAFEYYLRSLELGDDLESPDRLTTYGSIAELFFAVGDIKRAREFVSKARSVNTNNEEILLDISILGDIYLAEGKLDSARSFFEQLLDPTKRVVTNYDRVIAYRGLAQIELMTGDFEQAIRDAGLCYEIALTLDNKVYQVSSLRQLGQAEMSTGNHKAAEEHLKQSADIAQATSSIGELHHSYDLLADYFEVNEDYLNAYDFRMRAASIQDSLHARERSNFLALTMLNREIEMKDERTAALAERVVRDQQLIRNSVSFGIAMLLFGVFIALAVYLTMRFKGRDEDMTKAVTIGDTLEDSAAFIKRICVAQLMMITPIVAHSLIWNNQPHLLALALASLLIASVWTLAHFNRVRAAILLMIIGGYGAMATIPLYIGALNAIVLTIGATFIVLAYSIRDRRLQFLNAIAAIAAFVTFNLLLPEARDMSNSNPEGLEIMIGLLSLGTIFFGLYFYHGRLLRYREDLKNTNSFLRRITNINPHFVYAKDVDRRFTFVNRAMVDNYRVGYEDMLGQREEDLLTEEGVVLNITEELQVLESGETRYVDEERVLAHDGTEKWLQTIKRPITNSEGEIVGLLGVSTDITARLNSERQLVESLSMLEATLESTADGLLVVDLDYNIVQYNRRFLEMWNLDEAIMQLGDTKGIQIASQQLRDPAQFVNRIQEIYTNPEIETTDILHFTDGRIYERFSRAQKIDSRVVGRVWSFRDVTMRERATNEIKESEEKYRYIFENSDQAILLYDYDKRQMVDCNTKSLEVLGCSTREELLLHPMMLFTEPVQPGEQFVEQYLDHQLAQLLEQDTCSFELLGRRLHGETFIGYVTMIKNFSNNRRLIWYFISDVTESSKAREALERSEARFRAILEDNVFSIFTVKDGRLVDTNAAFSRMTGLSQEQLVGKKIAQIVHADDQQMFLAFIDQLQSGDLTTGSLDLRYNRKDGTIGYLIASAKAYHDTMDDSWEFIVTAADITQVKEYEKYLAESEERYRALFEEYPIGIVVVDIEKTRRGVTCNSKMIELFESTEERILEGNIAMFSPEFQPDGQNSRIKYQEIINSYTHTKKPVHFEWQFKKESGDLFLADVIYSPVYIHGQQLTMVLIQDNTALKEAEQKLRQSESRYRSLVEASPDGIIMTDVNGNLSFASQRLLQIVGIDDVELIRGKNIVDFTIPEDRERAASDLGIALTSRKRVFSRYQLRTRKGQLLPIELGAQVIDDAQGVTTGLICLVRDISEQYESERILRESEERYRLLFENTFDGFMILDDQGAIRDCNNSAVDLLSYPDVHMLYQKPLLELFPELQTRQDFKEALAGDVLKTQPTRLVGQDFFGMDVHVEVSFCQIPGDRGRKIACAIRNVAEKVILEKQEREIENQQVEMDALNREIASHTLFNSQKNRLLSEIKDEISAAASLADRQLQQALIKVNRKIDANLSESEDMVAFKIQFEKIHPNFFKRLLGHCSGLTNTDLKYCAYIRLNMTTHDICNLLYIEKKSVEMAKYRIKKKLGLTKTERLSEFIHGI